VLAPTRDWQATTAGTPVPLTGARHVWHSFPSAMGKDRASRGWSEFSDAFSRN